MESTSGVTRRHSLREPWNKGKIVGQKAPFKLRDIWALRVRFQMENRVRELALLNLEIDSKLRGCDLVSLKVADTCHADQVAARAGWGRHRPHPPVHGLVTTQLLGMSQFPRNPRPRFHLVTQGFSKTYMPRRMQRLAHA